MAVPKKKTTKSARNQRRSHHALKKSAVQVCANCKKPVLSHHVCSFCGFYGGKKVIDIKTKQEQKKEKGKEKDKSREKSKEKEEKQKDRK